MSSKIRFMGQYRGRSFFFFFFYGIMMTATACDMHVSKESSGKIQQNDPAKITPAAERTAQYFPLLKGKTIGIVANPASRIGGVHLLDTLLNAGFDVDRVLAPEHGFRGEAEAGEHVDSGEDPKTGVQIISVYGKNRKPSISDLQGLDMVIFDLQDVGVRFYTYISTMHYVMERCAEMGIEFMVLDRPNPNGFYMDGPVLNEQYQSFIGMHPIPLVHGMTTAELAKMINGEGWLSDRIQVKLTVIPVANYTHDSLYQLPIAPSPNLPNMKAVYLYPSLGLFEGTPMSIGRGTVFPFQVVGHPELEQGGFQFTPRSVPGASRYPKHQDETCFGWDLRDTSLALANERKIHLHWLIQSYLKSANQDYFFKPFFNKLAGNATLKQKIRQGWSEEKIRQSWQEELNAFQQKRSGYLLYPDFQQY
ncbi:MAG: exo-beta-N-acetylmuramidase NamZ family protein [Bacteroidota bacterium]